MAFYLFFSLLIKFLTKYFFGKEDRFNVEDNQITLQQQNLQIMQIVQGKVHIQFPEFNFAYDEIAEKINTMDLEQLCNLLEEHLNQNNYRDTKKRYLFNTSEGKKYFITQNSQIVSSAAKGHKLTYQIFNKRQYSDEQIINMTLAKYHLPPKIIKVEQNKMVIPKNINDWFVILHENQIEIEVFNQFIEFISELYRLEIVQKQQQQSYQLTDELYYEINALFEKSKGENSNNAGLQIKDPIFMQLLSLCEVLNDRFEHSLPTILKLALWKQDKLKIKKTQTQVKQGVSVFQRSYEVISQTPFLQLSQKLFTKLLLSNDKKEIQKAHLLLFDKIYYALKDYALKDQYNDNYGTRHFNNLVLFLTIIDNQLKNMKQRERIERIREDAEDQQFRIRKMQKQFLQDNLNKIDEQIKSLQIKSQVIYIQLNTQQEKELLALRQIKQRIVELNRHREMIKDQITRLGSFYQTLRCVQNGNDRDFSGSGSDSYNFFVKCAGSIFKRNFKEINYIKYQQKKDNGKVLNFKIKEDAIIGILGDWGTGKKDAMDLLKNLILQQKANIIIHIGDVYYSGTEKEFSSLAQKISQIKRDYPLSPFDFYAIPGNHDYYSGGKGFFKLAQLQSYTFFCLEEEHQKYQVIGLDTGKNGSNILSQWIPTKIQRQELKWAKEKIASFSGQTILLTHHQIFSTFQRVAWTQKQNNYNDQINSVLHEQFFDVIPKISCWIWGHEHKFAVYKPNSYGIPLSRLVGNSAWQQKEKYIAKQKYNKNNMVKTQHYPQINNKYVDHTAMVISANRDKLNSLKFKYIHMTSSYDKQSQRTKEKPFQQDVFPLCDQKVYTNKYYYIKDASGLSFSCSESTYLWFNYNPLEISFVTLNKKQSQVLKTGMKFRLQTTNNNISNKQFKTGVNYLTIQETQTKSLFFFAKRNNKDGEQILCGEQVFLIDSSTKQPFFRSSDMGMKLTYFSPGAKIYQRSSVINLEKNGRALQIYNPNGAKRVAS